MRVRMEILDVLRCCPLAYPIEQKKSPRAADRKKLLDELVRRGFVTKTIDAEMSDRKTAWFNLAITDHGRSVRDGYR